MNNNRFNCIFFLAAALLLKANDVIAIDIFSRTNLIQHANWLGRKLNQQQRSLVQVTSDGAITTLCQIIESSFNNEYVMCTCLGDIQNSFSISCEYTEETCNETPTGVTCAKPQIAVSMQRGKIFSATTCMKNGRRGILPIPDTCVFVDACPDNENEEDSDNSDPFCDCTASYDGQICRTCEMCSGGKSITVDCTNINVEGLSTTCQGLDLDLDLTNGAGQIVGFAPQFTNGFCSQLESTLDNTIECDCTNAVGGTFQINCATTEKFCQKEGHCFASVDSTVSVKDSIIDSVTACATYESPFGETCTTLEFNPDDEETKINSCVATYDGQTCKSCQVCPDGQSITIDCSDQFVQARIEECQPVTKANSYEFLPNYPKAVGQDLTFSDNKDDKNSNNKSASSRLQVGIFPASFLLIVSLVGIVSSF